MQKNQEIPIGEISAIKNIYEELVWYARKPRIDRVDIEYKDVLPDPHMRDVVKQCIRHTEKQYPDHVQKLKEDKTNFEHGFNSGCLASLRLILHAYSHGIDDAMDDFPNLNT